MSEDEFLVFGICILIAAPGWSRWYGAMFRIWPFERGKVNRIWFTVLPVICLLGIRYVLIHLASFDVIGEYILFYIVMGLAWIALGRESLYYLCDVAWRDDAIERNNAAAVWFVSGWIFGLTAIYAGANVGDGPGWWCVIFAGGLGLIIWYLLLGGIQLFCNIFERITVERDVALGLRMGFYLLASGIVLGRGAAGDWTSADQTTIEMLDAWPVLGLTLLAIIVEKWHNSESSVRASDFRIYGAILWGLIYLMIAILIVKFMPPLPQNPLYGMMELTLATLL